MDILKISLYITVSASYRARKVKTICKSLLKDEVNFSVKSNDSFFYIISIFLLEYSSSVPRKSHGPHITKSHNIKRWAGSCSSLVPYQSFIN